MKPLVVITVRHGAVQAVHGNQAVAILVHDWDCPERPLVVEFEAEPLAESPTAFANAFNNIDEEKRP